MPSWHFSDQIDTAKRTAKETGAGRRSVYRAKAFSKVVDVADEIIPGIRKDNNILFKLFCRLCSTYEHKAFLDGIQYGAHLILEPDQ